MTLDSPAVPIRRWRWKWDPLAAALLLVGGAGLAVGLQGQPRALPGPFTRHDAPPHGAAGSTQSAPTTVVAPGAAVATLTVRSAPLTLHIPAIGLAQPLALLGVNANGTVQVPTDIQQP